ASRGSRDSVRTSLVAGSGAAGAGHSSSSAGRAVGSSGASGASTTAVALLRPDESAETPADGAEALGRVAAGVSMPDGTTAPVSSAGIMTTARRPPYTDSVTSTRKPWRRAYVPTTARPVDRKSVG